MDEAQRQANLQRLAVAMQGNRYDPTIRMSGTDKFTTGIGSGMTNWIDVAKGLFGMRTMSREDKDALDRWLNATTAGQLGTATGEALPSLVLRR